MCNLLLHCSCYSIALNLLVFAAYTLRSPRLPNCLSSLHQMEPTPSQVRNHYSQKNQEAHSERILPFKQVANLHCPSSVCHPVTCHRASYGRWPMSPSSLMKQDHDPDQEICHDGSQDTEVSSISSNTKQDNLDHQQDDLFLGQVCRDKSLRTTRVSLPKERSRANTDIACPPVSKSGKPPGSMAPPLLKCQKLALLNQLSESDDAPSAQALPQPRSSGDQNGPPPKASADQNVTQHQMATFEVSKLFMKAIVFTKTPSPILPDDNYLRVEQAWTLAIEAQDHQRTLAGTSEGTASVCQLPSGPSLIIDPQTQEAVSLGYCLMVPCQIYNIDYAPKYT